MKYVIGLVAGAVIAFALTAFLAGALETALIAAIEFVVLACLFLLVRWLLERFTNQRVNPYVMFALALLAVIYVSYSTSAI